MGWIEKVAVSLVVSLAVSTSAFADVQVSINDGRVSIVAKNASAGEILTEWAKVGQMKIVNLEWLPRDLVTIELTNVSEQKALDVVLRRVSGYVAAQRVVAVPNASVFDRILVMPARMAPMPATTALVAAKVTAAPAPQAWSGQASTVQASAERTPASETQAEQTPAEQTPPDQAAASQATADPSAYQASATDPLAYQSSALYQKAMAAQAMPDSSPYSQQGVIGNQPPMSPYSQQGVIDSQQGMIGHPERTSGRRGTSLGRSQQGPQASQGSAQQMIVPIFQPQAAVGNVNANSANDVNEPPLSAPAGVAPAPRPSAQVTFASRHAMETINPLEYKVPIQLLQGAVPKSAPQTQSGVPVPGMIVRPPRQPGSPK